jgi:hypothetical protein
VPDDRKQAWIKEQLAKGLLSAEETRRKADELEAMGQFDPTEADKDALLAAGIGKAPPRSYASDDKIEFAGMKGEIRDLSEQDARRSSPGKTDLDFSADAKKDADAFDIFPPSDRSELADYGYETFGTANDTLSRRTARMISPYREIGTDRPAETLREMYDRRRAESASGLPRPAPVSASEQAAKLKSTAALKNEAESAGQITARVWEPESVVMSQQQAAEAGMLDEDGWLMQALSKGASVSVPGVGELRVALPDNFPRYAGAYDVVSDGVRRYFDSTKTGKTYNLAAAGLSGEPSLDLATGKAVYDTVVDSRPRALDITFNGVSIGQVGEPWMVKTAEWLPQIGANALYYAGMGGPAIDQFGEVIDEAGRISSGEGPKEIPLPENAVSGALVNYTPFVPLSVGALGSVGLITKEQEQLYRRQLQLAQGRDNFDALIPLAEAVSKGEGDAKFSAEDDLKEAAMALSYQDIRVEARAGVPSVEAARAEEGKGTLPSYVEQIIMSGSTDEQIQRALNRTPLRDLPDSVRSGAIPSVDKIVSTALASAAAKEGTGVKDFDDALKDFNRHTGFVTDAIGRVSESPIFKIMRMTGFVPSAIQEMNISTDSIYRSAFDKSAADVALALPLGLGIESAETLRPVINAVAGMPFVPTVAGLDNYFASGAGSWVGDVAKYAYETTRKQDKAAGDVVPDDYYSWLDTIDTANYQSVWRTQEMGYFSRVAAVVESGDMASRYSEILRGAGMEETSWPYRTTLVVENLIDMLTPWESVPGVPVSALGGAIGRAKAARTAARGAGAGAAAVAAAAPSLRGARDGISAVSAAVESNVHATVAQGKSPFDSLPPATLAQVREALRNADVDPAEAEARIKAVVALTGPAHFEAMKELLAGGTPASQALRQTPEWQAVRSQMDDLVKAGNIPAGKDNWILAYQEMRANLLALDPASPITKPEDYFGQIRFVINGTPGPNALFSSREGGGISDPVNIILQEVLRAADEEEAVRPQARPEEGDVSFEVRDFADPVDGDAAQPSADPAEVPGAGAVGKRGVRLRGLAGVEAARPGSGSVTVTPDNVDSFPPRTVAVAGNGSRWTLAEKDRWTSNGVSMTNAEIMDPDSGFFPVVVDRASALAPEIPSGRAGVQRIADAQTASMDARKKRKAELANGIDSNETRDAVIIADDTFRRAINRMGEAVDDEIPEDAAKYLSDLEAKLGRQPDYQDMVDNRGLRNNFSGQLSFEGLFAIVEAKRKAGRYNAEKPAAPDFGFDDLVTTSSAPNAPENRATTQAFYNTFGAEVLRDEAGAPVNTKERLKIYDLSPLIRETYEATKQGLVEFLAQPGQPWSGWSFGIFGPEKLADGTFGPFKPADFKKSYDQFHAWFFNPEVGAGSFHDPSYTLIWRAFHEIVHGVLNDRLTLMYGGTGTRAGALGIEAVAPNGKVAKALTLADVMRAIEWEHETFEGQRQMMAKAGITITDEQFAKENFLNMMDATYRSITGQFSDPGLLGVDPPAMPPAEVLRRAKDMLRARAAELGLDMSETFYEQRGERSPEGAPQPDQGQEPSRPLFMQQVELFPGVSGSNRAERLPDPDLVETTAAVFHSELRRAIEQKMPAEIKSVPPRVIPAKFTPERTVVIDKKTGATKVIPEQTVPEKTVPGQTIAEQIRAMLRDTSVKQDEIDWVGFNDYIERLGDTVSKADVLKFLDENPTRLVEDWLGAPDPKQIANANRAAVESERLKTESDRIGREISQQLEPVMSDRPMSFGDDGDIWDEKHIRVGDSNHWSVVEARRFLVDNGGEALAEKFDEARALYKKSRDLKDESRPYAGRKEAKWVSYNMDGGTNHREILARVPGLSPTWLYEAHWGQIEDVVAHARIADYEVRGSRGSGKGLGVNETQADGHQAGAKHGYASPGDSMSAEKKAEKQRVIDIASDVNNSSVSELSRYQRYNYVRNLVVYLEEKGAIEKWWDSDWDESFDEGWDPPDHEEDYELPVIHSSPDRGFRVYEQDGEFTSQRSDGYGRGWLTYQTFDNLEDAKEGCYVGSAVAGDVNGDLRSWKETAIEELEAMSTGLPPNMPFGNTWTELLIKRTLRYAAENGYSYYFWSPASVHIERWGTDVVRWADDGDGYAFEYKSQEGGAADGVDMEAEAERRGLLQRVKSRVSKSSGPDGIRRELARARVEEGEIEHLAQKIWSQIQANPEGGAYRPRASGLEFTYDQRIPKIVEKMIKKWGGKVENIRMSDGKNPLVNGADRKTFIGEIPNPVEMKDARDSFPTGSPEWRAIEDLREFSNEDSASDFFSMFGEDRRIDLDARAERVAGVVTAAPYEPIPLAGANRAETSFGIVDWDAVAKALGGTFDLPPVEDASGMLVQGLYITPEMRKALTEESQALYSKTPDEDPVATSRPAPDISKVVAAARTAKLEDVIRRTFSYDSDMADDYKNAISTMLEERILADERDGGRQKALKNALSALDDVADKALEKMALPNNVEARVAYANATNIKTRLRQIAGKYAALRPGGLTALAFVGPASALTDWGPQQIAKMFDGLEDAGYVNEDINVMMKILLEAFPEGSLDRVRGVSTPQPTRADLGQAQFSPEGAMAMANTADNVLVTINVHSGDRPSMKRDQIPSEIRSLTNEKLVESVAKSGTSISFKQADSSEIAYRLAEGSITKDEVGKGYSSDRTRDYVLSAMNRATNDITLKDGRAFVLMHELAHGIDITALSDAERRVVTRAYNRARERGYRGESLYAREVEQQRPGTATSIAEFWAENFAEFAVFHKLPEVIAKLPEAAEMQTLFERVHKRFARFWELTKDRVFRKSKADFDPELLALMDRFFDDTYDRLSKPEEYARRTSLESALNPLYQRSSGPSSRVTVALTGFRPEFPDLARAWSNYKDASRRSTDILAQAKDAGRALTGMEARAQERYAKRAKEEMQKLYELYAPDLQKALTEGADPSLVRVTNMGAEGPEKAFGGWMGDPGEPPIYLTLEGDPEVILGRLARFSSAYDQGGQLVRVLREDLAVPDVVSSPRAPLSAEARALLVDENAKGGPRAATLTFRFSDEGMSSTALDALYEVLAEFEMGWTLAYENGTLQIAHTPEWSGQTPDDFIETARVLAAKISSHAKKTGFRVDIGWSREDIYVSGPKAFSNGVYSVSSYKDQVAAGYAREQAVGERAGGSAGGRTGEEAGADAGGADPGAGRRESAGTGVAEPRDGSGEGQPVAPSASLLEDLTRGLGVHLDRAGATPHAVVDTELMKRISASGLSKTKQKEVATRLRIGKASPLQLVSKPVKVKMGKVSLSFDLTLLRTDGFRALVPSGKTLSFSDLDYLGRRPVWLAPPFERAPAEQVQALAVARDARVKALAAGKKPGQMKAIDAAIRAAEAPLKVLSEQWKTMGFPEDVADEASGLKQERSFSDAQLDAILERGRVAYDDMLLPLYDRHTRSLGIVQYRPKVKLDAKGVPTKEYLEKLHVHLLDQLGIHLFTLLSNGTNIVSNQVLAAAIRPRSREALSVLAETVRRAVANKGSALSMDEANAILGFAVTAGAKNVEDVKFFTPEMMNSLGKGSIRQWDKPGAPELVFDWQKIRAVNAEATAAFVERVEEMVSNRDASLARLEASLQGADVGEVTKISAAIEKVRADRDGLLASLEEAKINIPTQRPQSSGAGWSTATPVMQEGVVQVSNGNPSTIAQFIVQFDEDLRRVENGEQLYSWYEPHPDESAAEFITRMQSSISGMGSKISSFSVAMTMPSAADAAAVDTHMIKLIAGKLLGDRLDPLRRNWYERWKAGNGRMDYGADTPTAAAVEARKGVSYEQFVVNNTGEWVTNIQDMLAPDKKITRPRGQSLDPAARRVELERAQLNLDRAIEAGAPADDVAKLTEKLTEADSRLQIQTWAKTWQERYGASPQLQAILDGKYAGTTALYQQAVALIREDADKKGVSTFTMQWLAWDKMRRYYEPELAVYAGAASVPGMGAAALVALNRELAANKYLSVTPKNSVLPVPRTYPESMGGLDRILLEMKDGVPAGAFEWDPVAQQYLIHFFETGDFDTFLHEDGHLLTALLGQKWYGELIKHFETTPGGASLTRNGYEQLAEAMRWYVKTRMAPSGRMRAALDTFYVHLQGIWSSVRKTRPVLPTGMAILWDTTFRPDTLVRMPALKMVTEQNKGFPTVRVAGLPEERVVEGAVLRSGRAREASRVDLRKENVRQALGLKNGQTEVDVVDVVAKAIAYVVTENYRKTDKNGKLVRLTMRTIIPSSRVKSVQKTVRERILAAIGINPKDVSINGGEVVFDQAQRAGLRLLIDELAAEPLGNAIPADLMDPSNDLSRVTSENYNQLLEVLIDVHAGVGARRARYASEAPASIGYAMWRAVRDGISDLGKVSEQIRRVQDEFTTTFKVSDPGEGYVHPQLQEMLASRVRELGGIHDWLMGIAEQAKTANPATTIGGLLQAVRGQLTPPVAVPHVLTLASLEAQFSGAGGVATRVDDVTLRLPELSGILQRHGMASEQEMVSLRVLQVYHNLKTSDPVGAAAMLANYSEPIADSMRVVHSGLRRRLQLVEARAHEIGLAIGGSKDANIMLNRSREEKLRLYSWFYSGQWDRMFDWAASRGRELGLENERIPHFDSGTAVLEMIVRFRAQEVLSRLSDDLARYGIESDVSALTKDRAIGSMDRDLFVDRVKFYINNEVSWDATRQVSVLTDNTVHVPNAPPGGTYPPREWKFPTQLDDIGNPHDMDAYTTAHELLEQWGFKHGKGEWNRYQLADGSELLLPQMVIDELESALDRAAKVGTAYGSPQDTNFGDKLGVSIGIEPKRSTKMKMSIAAGQALDTLVSTFGMTFSLVNTGLTTGVGVPNPAYFIGNVVGGVFQVLMKMGLIDGSKSMFSEPGLAGAVTARLWKDGRYAPEVKPLITSDGRIYTADMIAGMVNRTGLRGGMLQAETARSIARDIRDLDQAGWRRLMKYPRAWQNTLAEAAGASDNYFRVGIFIEELKQGKSPSMAAESARSALFDYGRLTDREKMVFRKGIMFYGFFRNNMNLFFDTLLTNPGRILAVARLTRGMYTTYSEDDPDLVVPDYYQSRLALYFRQAAEQTHLASQVVTLAPPTGPLEPISFFIDVFGAMKGDGDSIRGLASRTNVMIQAPFVLATDTEIFSGRDIYSSNRVPGWFIEIDRMLGGTVTNDILNVQLRPERDPTRSEMAGERWYHARNGKAWWMIRNILQVPGAGRSMDTIAMADRANIGIVEAMVDSARWARRSAADAGYVDPAPTGTADTAGPRGNMTEGDELMSLLGFKTITIPTRGVVEDRLAEEQKRLMLEKIKELEKGDPYRYKP